jgi:formate hydrogenlyase subunit 3/multisubunit Na+/H+ antiporter MnhD subunit
MQIPYMLLQVIILPMTIAVLTGFAGKRMGKRLGWLVFAILAYTTFLLLVAGIDLWIVKTPMREEYSWTSAVFNLTFGFQADSLSLPVALIMNLICTALAVYSVRYMEHRIEQLYGKENRGMYAVYYSVYLLFSIGLVGVALSTNLIELYVFVELALIPAYILIDLFGYEDRHRIAMMYFLWNHVGAALFLVGTVLAFSGNGGSFDITALSRISGTSLGFWVCFLVLLGWLFKMAAFGFHVWIPYAHGNSPTSIAAIVATIVGLGNYVIVRLLFGQMYVTFQAFSLPIMVLALITMIYGAFLTMAQDDVKRLYACSTISQTAYSLLGIASLTSLGVEGGVFYFLSHIIGKCILFSVAGVLVTQTGLRNMKEMGGLARKMPLTATLCIIGSMILSAMPPLSGFQAEWILFSGVFQQGINGAAVNLTIAVIGIFATFLTVVYTFWPAVRIFFGELPASLENVKEAPLSMTAPLFVLAGVSFVIGVFPDLITRLLSQFFV